MLAELGVIHPSSRVYPDLKLPEHLIPLVPVLDDPDIVPSDDEDVVVFGLSLSDVAEGVDAVFIILFTQSCRTLP